MDPGDRENCLTVGESLRLLRAKVNIVLAILCLFVGGISWASFGIMVWGMRNDRAGNLIVAAIILGIMATCITLYLYSVAVVILKLIPTFMYCAKCCLVRHQWSIRFGSYWQRAVCKSDCKTSLEQSLCDRCHKIVGTSSLLTGGLWPLVPSIENHKYYKWQELEVSAATCQLCQLLLLSVKSLQSARLSIESPTPSGGSRSIFTAQTGEILNLRISETISIGQGLQVCLQLQGGNIFDSEILCVKQGKVHRGIVKIVPLIVPL
jgi:hypothetical protein